MKRGRYRTDGRVERTSGGTERTTRTETVTRGDGGRGCRARTRRADRRASHTKSHLALRLDRTTTVTETNRGYASENLFGDPSSDDYVERYATDERRPDPYDEVGPYAFATTKSRPENDIRSRAWVGRRFAARGDVPTTVSITVDGRAGAATETGPGDRATAIVRIRLYDHTTGEFLRERLLREVRARDGADDRQYGTYRRTFEPVLSPDTPTPSPSRREPARAERSRTRPATQRTRVRPPPTAKWTGSGWRR